MSNSRDVTLEPFDADRLPLLERWLHAPHVAPWYPYADENLRWAAAPPAGAGQAIIAVAGVPVGYLRWQAVDRAALDALGLTEIPEASVDADILLGDEHGTGKGAGVAALLALIERLRADPRVPLIGLTTSIANVRAHRAFAKAGFHIARQYDPEGLGRCHLMLHELQPEQPVRDIASTRPRLYGVYLFVREIEASACFYRLLGLRVNVVSTSFARAILANGLSLEFGTTELTQSYDPTWRQHPGIATNSINLEFTHSAQVDAVYAAVVNAGGAAQLAPFDAPWRARFAILIDPDGNFIGLHGPRNRPLDRAALRGGSG